MNVDFRTSAYFSPMITFVGGFVGMFGLTFINTNPIQSSVLALIGLFVVTTHYRLSIDFEKKVYHDYLWILGMKNGERGNFDKIEYLFIKKSKVSQTMYLRVASSTIQKEVYDGFLKFSEDNKLHLLTKDGKKDLIDKLRKISTALKVKIVDYSEGEPVEI